MTNFRNNPPQEIGGSKVVVCKDYQTLELTQADGSKQPIDMPTTSNVLQWFCEDETKISVRPSGTEPKIKFYIEIKDNDMTSAQQYEAAEKAAADEVIQMIEALPGAEDATLDNEEAVMAALGLLQLGMNLSDLFKHPTDTLANPSFFLFYALFFSIFHFCPLEITILQIGFPIEENFSSYSVITFPSDI